MKKFLDKFLEIIFLFSIIIIGGTFLNEQNRFPSGFNSFTFRNWFGFSIIIFAGIITVGIEIKRVIVKEQFFYKIFFYILYYLLIFCYFFTGLIFEILESEIYITFPKIDDFQTNAQYNQALYAYIDKFTALSDKKQIFYLIFLAVIIVSGFLYYIFSAINEKQNKKKDKLL